MTPEDFQQARQSLGLSAPDLARVLGVSPTRARQTFSDWSRGAKTMDPARARLVRAYLAGYRPPDWPIAGE
jgi:DNA-binding transcriptional regulator YiaG